MGRSSSPRVRHLKGRLAAGVLKMIGVLPMRLNRWLGRTLGWLAWVLPSPDRRIAEINLQLCLPELSASEQRRLLRQTLTQSGLALAESAFVWQRPDEAVALVQQVSGYEALTEALEQGHSVLLLAPHYGCWEVLNFWLAQRVTIHALFNPSGLPALDELIQRSRQHYGSTVYPATARGLGGLIRALRQAPAVTGILPDQVPERGSGRFVPFFGQPAYTATLAVKMVQQLNARVFVASARRLPGGGYHVEFSAPEPGLYETDLDTALTALNLSLETLIRTDPSQYMWSYKRFRRTPPGARKVYQ
ncbi:lysophospholipid acyltransferase family protein [Isoalcanivorax beigongshangi]|uniref:Lysophospholipid acyltransferase family protein n=1 Tax=Isoalcanivorax beigongshangi TaxID=3238810 RepID=A0ABV4AHZ1_9GAMM